MYGGGNGIGPIAGGAGSAALAYTGTGNLVLPLIVAGIAITIGILLSIRNRKMRKLTAA